MFSSSSSNLLYMLIWLPMIAGILWRILNVLIKINQNLENSSSQNSPNLVKVNKKESKQKPCSSCGVDIPIMSVICPNCDKEQNVSWPTIGF